MATVSRKIKPTSSYYVSITKMPDYYSYQIKKNMANPQVICSGYRMSAYVASIQELQQELEATVIKRLNTYSIKSFTETQANLQF